jgi:probable DNA metabolism protein
MRHIALASETDFAGWREAARQLAADGVDPAEIVWGVAGDVADLFAAKDQRLPEANHLAKSNVSVPRRFVELAATAILHRDPGRFALLYRLLVRLKQTPALMAAATDRDVARAESLAKEVRRDKHKMTAFVRFREIADESGARFVAWFEPSHRIVEATAPFFVRRFASILTPDISAHWDCGRLAFGPGATRADAPLDDAVEDVWRRYYASIFNPARLKVAAMRAEMPKKYWRNLPEAPLIEPLIAEAQKRTKTIVAEGETQPNPRPHRLEIAQPRAEYPEGSLDALREAAQSCRACPLWRPATQTVFGEGPPRARLMFVGEQPGDKEDIAGRPFVGPAGQLFDRALKEAGIARDRAYVTNAVKHFKFTPRGKIRLHQKPGGGEIAACRSWLTREIALVRPDLIVALGATAAQSLFGRPTPIGKTRGRIVALDDGRNALVTVHPSYLLRLPDRSQAEEEFARFVSDLSLAQAQLRNAA